MAKDSAIASRHNPMRADDAVVMSQQELTRLLEQVGHIAAKTQLTIQGIKELHHILRASHTEAIESAILMGLREQMAKAQMPPEAYAMFETLYLQPTRQQAYSHLFDAQTAAFTQIREYVAGIPIEPQDEGIEELVQGVRETFLFGLLK